MKEAWTDTPASFIEEELEKAAIKSIENFGSPVQLELDKNLKPTKVLGIFRVTRVQFGLKLVLETKRTF